ncbi:MAG: hypothetical protein ACU85U_22920 [Gammaproteobacteria bacterium]|jgi:hypothetical protein
MSEFHNSHDTPCVERHLSAVFSADVQACSRLMGDDEEDTLPEKLQCSS